MVSGISASARQSGLALAGAWHARDPASRPYPRPSYKCLLRRMLDPEEFLSDYGIRSVSKYHRDHPYRLIVQGEEKIVNYEPAESQTGIFGGNSNWRGPVWFPINYLLIESL